MWFVRLAALLCDEEEINDSSKRSTDDLNWFDDYYNKPASVITVSLVYKHIIWMRILMKLHSD